MQNEIQKTEVDYVFEERARYGNYEIRTKIQDIDIAGDHIAGALLSRLVYWDEKASIVRDGFRWFAKSVDDLYEEIRITENQFKRSIKILEREGIVVKAHYKFNGMRTNHFRIDRRRYEECLRECSRNRRTGTVESNAPTDGGNHQTGTVEITVPIQRIHTNNTIKKKVANAPRFSFSSPDMDFARTMYSMILDVVPGMKSPDFESWANDIRLIRERDKKSFAEMISLFVWANDHEFWRANILSPKKLRKQWDNLMAQKLSDKKPKQKDNDEYRKMIDEIMRDSL